MSEIKLPRLLQAAKEFNIGQDTLVEFLVGKGFSKDDLKPSTKLSEAMYVALQQGFQSDKAAKLKSDKVDLPKGVGGESKKRKEDEEPLQKKEPVIEPVVEQPPVAEPVEEIKEPSQPEPQSQPEPEPQPEPQPEPEVKVEEPQPVEPVVPAQEEPKKEDNIIKASAPGIEGPKILDKIDLSALEKSTRPKKPSPQVTEQKPVVVKEKEPPFRHLCRR
ncbi:hypothetical protein [Niabella ginsengisoli]|uniref:Translation initiation factor IF-2 n=1 Tax=Niabella ginsengisoli TaxID=522298 RepID=A0ABS9SP87_9BACT|nr:hypothetical protein [Niabella ginsengisoli]MCH5600175.1 hypothetical protein [Niabella ginsengisoli]